MLRRLYDWVMSLAATRYAEAALGVIAFIESSFFPIPPDALIIPMALSERRKWVRIGLVATVGSVLGAYLGYAIGAVFYDVVGRPLIEFYGKAEAFNQLKGWYDEWGGWAVLFAALTPFPYKVMTIFSGVVKLDLLTFTAVSIIGRGIRFFLVAWLLSRFGAPIQTFIEKNLGLLFTLFMVLLIGGFVAVRYMF
ncbi:YqaA family protein [Consotaella salsifontis]|uniref:Membrane protein YqaA, SNARE-associated domain n=1 Tax=Consotaella salsifontis TaxID=1365950 RepID=A0A1T4RTE6_9HYPH|nr:YqaA family protein [Consotaella salsifontis]SKA18871.1 membrane protein YqaA, SNARE-associated domain [Consotaella salsifontis]